MEHTFLLSTDSVGNDSLRIYSASWFGGLALSGKGTVCHHLILKLVNGML